MSKSTIHLIVDSGPKQGETLDRKSGSLVRIGRVVSGNTLAIKDPSISQKHLTIKFDPQVSRWVLRDLDTANGTFVNGDRVPSSAPVNLSDGDAIKIGECSSISVKISVVEENVGGIMKNGGRRGRCRSKKADDSEEVGDGNCEMVSSKDEILDSAVEGRGEEVPEDLKRGRKRSSNGDSSKDEVLGSGLDDRTEAKNLKKFGRRTNSTRVLKKGKSLATAIEDRMEALKNLGKSDKGDDLEEINDQNCGRVPVKDEILYSAMEDGAKEVPTYLGRGRKRKSSRGSKRDEILESALDDRIEVLEQLRRVEGMNSSGVSNKNEIPETVVKDRMKASENLGRGRRGKSAKVSKTDGVVEDNNNAPKNLGRGRRTKSTQVLEKDPSLDSVADVRTEQPEQLGEHIRENSTSASMHDENSEPAVEGVTEAPMNLRRGRSANLVLIPKKEEVLADNVEVPKTTRGGRRTRSAKVSEKVAEDEIQVPKNVGRGRRTNSAQVSGLDVTLDSALEGRTEAPNNLGRGKRRANSSKASNADEILDVVVDDAIEVTKNDGRGKPRRAPVRRTRASSRVSKVEPIIQPAQSNLKDPVLNPVENLYQSNELREGSHQLGQSDTQIQLVSSFSADSKEKRSQSREDKENYVSVKCQKMETESTTTRNSYYKRSTDGERHDSGSVATQTHKPSHVLPKVWNGNGIPNTTTKYKEDSKVNWHATPFEERLEKALSDDKIFPQRKLTN